MRIRHSGGCLTPWLLLFLLAASSSNADNLGESFLLFLLFSGCVWWRSTANHHRWIRRPSCGFVAISSRRTDFLLKKEKKEFLFLLHCYVIGSSADVGSDFDRGFCRQITKLFLARVVSILRPVASYSSSYTVSLLNLFFFLLFLETRHNMYTLELFDFLLVFFGVYCYNIAFV